MSSVFSTQHLKTAGLRSTRDRHQLLDLFLEDRTWTATQLHTKLPGINLTTIYRNLQHFKGAGIIAEAHTHNGEQHFERADTTHHDHHVCDSCNLIECVPCPIPKQAIHHLEFIGTCGACS